MKILHTSDWHLGKKLFKESRLDEQKSYLEWLLDFIKKDIDLLVIAGDIFDVPNPPNEASKIYYQFLAKVQSETHVHVLIISGNHDSSHFLEAPRDLLDPDRITLITKTDDTYFFQRNDLNIAGENIEIISMPFFRTSELMLAIRNTPELHSDSQDIAGHSEEFLHEALDYFLEKISPKKDLTKGPYRLFVGHHLFGHFISSGSEIGVTLSGVESLGLHIFKDRFHYMALGHIHKPQIISKEAPRARYSGSPLPFRFSETENKSMVLIDTIAKTEEVINLPIFRRMIRLKWDENDDLSKRILELKNLLQDKKAKLDLSPLIELELSMISPRHELISRIKDLFAESNLNIISLIVNYSDDQSKNEENSIKIKHLTTEELFKLHYQKKYPNTTEVPAQIFEDFKMILESARHPEGEA